MSVTAVEHHDIPAQPAPPAPEVGELAWVDPRELVVRTNVRGDTTLDRHFVRDIADRGVREPIPVRRRDDGALVVRKGHRRTLAAIEAGLQRVRVFIEPGRPGDEDAADQIDRIIDQLGENQHRAQIADADEVRAHQQLLDLGLSAGQIARRTHTPTQRVRATTAVARSELAAAVLDRYDLTLDQVAIIAEFDDQTDDGVEAVKLLTVTAQRDATQFPHVAQRLRDDRADQQLHVARVQELREAGVAVVDADTAGAAVALTGLRPAPTDPDGAELTETAHAECPGHAAQVQVRRGWGRDEPTVVTTYVCTDPTCNGHAPRWGGPPRAGVAGGGRGPGPMTDEEKAERRRVIENNRAWDSAAVVRAEWVTNLLARKSAPRDAARYIATTLARGSHDVRRAMENAHPTACRLLGLPEPAGSYSGKPNPIAVAADTAGTARLTMLTLAVLLGAAEDALGRHTWRSPTAENRAYFTALDSWGYPLSPVERLVIDPDADREAAADDGTGSDRDQDTDGGGEPDGPDGSSEADEVDEAGDER